MDTSAEQPPAASDPDAVPGEPGADPDAYALGLGDRLRRVRQQQGLSLHDVEQRSGGALKASVVGAYERGERAVSITRLQRLASFYRVPVAELLPAGEDERDRLATRTDATHIVLDLVALERHRAREPELLRYAETIQARRGDRNGRVLTVRASDLQTLAAVLASSPEELRLRLEASGIVR